MAVRLFLLLRVLRTRATGVTKFPEQTLYNFSETDPRFHLRSASSSSCTLFTMPLIKKTNLLLNNRVLYYLCLHVLEVLSRENTHFTD